MNRRKRGTSVVYTSLYLNTCRKNLPQEDVEENFLERERERRRKMDDGYLDGNVSWIINQKYVQNTAKLCLYKYTQYYQWWWWRCEFRRKPRKPYKTGIMCSSQVKLRGKREKVILHESCKSYNILLFYMWCEYSPCTMELSSD